MVMSLYVIRQVL